MSASHLRRKWQSPYGSPSYPPRETWALFIDLVKAFDSASREALFSVLLHFGLPDHFVNVAIRLQEMAKIKVESELVSSIGPLLLLIKIQHAS